MTPTSRTLLRPRPTPAFVRTGPTMRRGWGLRPGPWLPSKRGVIGSAWPTPGMRIMSATKIYVATLSIYCVFVFEPNVYIYYNSWYKTTVLSKFVTSITVSINDVYDILNYPYTESQSLGARHRENCNKVGNSALTIDHHSPRWCCKKQCLVYTRSGRGPVWKWVFQVLVTW